MKLTGWCNFIVLLPTLGEKNTSNHSKNQVVRKSFFSSIKRNSKRRNTKILWKEKGQKSTDSESNILRLVCIKNILAADVYLLPLCMMKIRV